MLGQLKRLTCDSPLWFATFGGYLTSLEGVELDMDWWQRILSLRNYLFSPFIASILVLCSSGTKTIWLIVCRTAEFIFVKILFVVKFQMQLFRSFSNSVVIQRKLQIKYQSQLCHRWKYHLVCFKPWSDYFHRQGDKMWFKMSRYLDSGRFIQYV